MSDMQVLSAAVESGKRDEARRLTQALLDGGANPIDIVDRGLVPGMSAIGDKFKRNEVFVPEMLVAAAAMKECMKLLEPLLAAGGIKPKHTVVIGTVQGDLHDIGKNLVAMMWRGANINVIDLGTNVRPAKFVEALAQHGARVVGLSALLTTTMPSMKTAVEAIRAAGLPDVKVIVGGAPVTAEYAREIGRTPTAPTRRPRPMSCSRSSANRRPERRSMHFTSLAIADPADLCFGMAPSPLRTRRGMTIGGGLVYPELNFTLPAMLVDGSTMPEVRRQYRQIITGALQRAVELEAPGLVVEFETLPPMTEHPAWGIELASILLEGMENAHAHHGLKSVLRMTPNDTREMERPPRMRSGPLWECMLETFDGAARAGAELLSIESVGGKEVHDDALTMGDIGAVVFGLCVMGVRDMRFLWTALHEIGARHGVHCAGDTACGFGNTAMVLAEQRMIPRVFAAVVRAISAVRTLVGYECGCVGPGKDCGYENPILKAITGFPMAMEGKTSACAHLSPLGNIAAATCDTWSNESVQNVKLLGGMAPTCYVEQLIYDCRLMNQSLADGPGAARLYQSWMVRSDAPLDPQAYVLTPESAIVIARSIVTSADHYAAGRAAGLTAVRLLRDGAAAGAVRIGPREVPWLDRLEQGLSELPDAEQDFVDLMLPVLDTTKFVAEDYGL